MLLKFLATFSAAIFIVSSFFAQNNNFKLEPNEQRNFYEIQSIANDYFGNPSREELLLKADNDFVRYKRWEWYWKDRVMPDGSFPDLIEQKRIYDELNRNATNENRDLTNPWTNINQTTGDGGYNGMGRASAIAFHPTDPNVYYVGAPIGGIWKTTDGGLTYAAIGDSLPYVSVGNICVDHENPDNIYITIGDSNGWWNYGLGVYKSSDGGITWQPTTNTWDFTSSVAFQRMTMNPVNSDEIFVAQTNGLYRTQDGGETWDVVHSGSHRDVVFQPGSVTSLYCATDDYWGSSEVYKSDDNGESWFQVTDFNDSGNYINLSVTPADHLVLGIQTSIGGDTELYGSIDGGLNVHFISYMPEDGVIIYSPTNASRMYCGFVVTYASENEGMDWDQITDWYDSGEYTEVHADNRFVAYHPITNQIFFCNDGGVYKYNENTTQWTELTSGLIITQYYRVAVSQVDDIFMIGGTQDNGGRKRVGLGNWDATNGGDAMEVAINHEDDQIIYTTYIYGTLYRSYDQWEDDTYNEITPWQTNGGQWVTPYALSPDDPSIVFSGYEEVYRSMNEGESWEAISDDLTGDVDNDLTTLTIAPSNSDVIYATRNNTVYYTLNGGTSWDEELVAPGIGNGATVSSLVVHPNDPAKIWVTVNGYATGKKVYYSQNSGVTFTNVSYNLPNIPANASVIDKESPYFDLYIGTDVGVFVFNVNANQWDYFGAGMPNTSVTDLEIQYSSRKLIAATYGRGIWENNLNSQPGVSVISVDATKKTRLDLLQNPVGDFIILNIHNAQNRNGQFVIYSVDGRVVYTEKQNLPEGNYQVLLDSSQLSKGIYMVEYQFNNGVIPALKFVKE